MKEKQYNIDLCKGTGLIQETILLLMMYKSGLSKQEMTREAITSNILVKASDKRIKDIVEIAFFKRYVNDDPSIPVNLQVLLTKSLSLDVVTQLFLIYTSRANLILMDFIIQVYWPEVRKGTKDLNFNYSRKFISETIRQTDLISGWSETTQKRMASYIISTLVDFRFLDKERKVKPVFLHDFTANYLAHELHFKGLSDNAIVESNDWKLFGYSRLDTINHLERLSFQGHFIFQNSGEIVKINWSYKNMQEFTHAFR
jgi:hypothetical protein